MLKPQIGHIILAAGGSRRLGHPKQLVKLNEKTLVELAVRKANELDCDATVMVIGSGAADIIYQLREERIETVINKAWDRGISTSIRSGLQRLIEIIPKLDAVLISLVDQPLISKKHFSDLIKLYQSEQPLLVCTSYADQEGVPAIFGKNLFSDLLNLKGDKGAKSIIQKCQTHKSITCEMASYDIDTEDDINEIRKHISDSN